MACVLLWIKQDPFLSASSSISLTENLFGSVWKLCHVGGQICLAHAFSNFKTLRVVKC